ncbi:MAG: DUF932 domain-containing protein [Turneriella sp.]|nr:DUF932 domain-containing protein [Turneriella sp.]
MMDQIPAVYAERPIGVSENYTFIPTTKVISDLEALGWMPATIKGSKSNPVAKHLIRFRQDIAYSGEAPEIVLVNAYNGLSSFRLMAGIFRLVCGNGLIICQSLFEAISIRHIHYTLEEVSIAVSKYLERLPLVMGSVEKLKSIEMTRDRSLEFAREAMLLRWPERLPEVDPYELATPWRSADKVNNLWSVFNVVQEKLVTGKYLYDARRHKLRGLTNVDKTIIVNQGLFELALRYAA